ncbi:CRISPR-associated protein Csx11 [Chloroflexus aggregans]|uniref:CRISPR-associated protein, Csx11 family n=1 Tax=Chloroflexus aggregans (strain MD-66 / DSM 9485) TaxID=326427 RepID=B8GB62_CHLAD|nr:CRISPR-associated protein Csx11 [Chloroflexus aggregans]ACL26662.1 CRISPR-associated protein, Csx11 family [Chloroflexus aggregans DSM 9485]
MNQLDVLAQHREMLLLAEAIGWLHDYRKCSDEQLKVQASNPQGSALPRNALANRYSQLTGVNLHLPVQAGARTVTNLLDDSTWKNDLLGQYLSRCHNTAHFDKQEPVGGKQAYPGMQISSPFGLESAIPNNLTAQMWALPWASLANYSQTERQNLLSALDKLFTQVGADTRRPINEVDLWSWGLLVGALYKAALAGALLTGSIPACNDLRWRLLSVRVNGFDYLLNVDRIPDLLAKQELLTDCLNRVRDVLEVTYPVGSEVYRDENGSVFVVPDVSDLLAITDSSGQSLRKIIEQAFAQGTVKSNSRLQLGGELTPHLELEQRPWWGQDPNWPRSSNDELPDISSLLNQMIVSPANAADIGQYWDNKEATDICTVCGLRPQGPSGKATERNVCDICEARRADRSKQWATSETDRTIWIDEVADTNGRFALIVGQFDLTHWLDGSLLQSLLLIAPHDPQNTNNKPVTSKTPSFSRLRRIWETTRAFWHEVQDATLQALSDDRRRLKMYLDQQPNLGPFHVYDLVVGPTDLSVVWVPPQNGEKGYLLTADNLCYIARQLGAESGIYTSPAAAAIFVEEYLCEQFVKHARQPILRNPDASPSQGRANLVSGIKINQIDYQQNAYATAIPILAEPRSFLMLVPADKSLEVLKQIKAKYECEMGKVRDRLPLHLGCVFAARRTPIRAVLEAGRAMLDREPLLQQWQIKWVDRQPSHVVLQLERSGYSVQWQIPLKMGDGTTDDLWYPYFFLETNGDDSKADASNRRAVKVLMPQSNGKKVDEWIVHAGDLRIGETIYRWSSTFDFEFLDTTARRFEIYYDEHGRRPRRTRPFYLEDLDRLEELWCYMMRLTKTQRHQVIRTIEATREAWYGPDDNGQPTTDQVFKQFVADTLAGAAWPKGQDWNTIPAEWRDKLIQAGVRGELADLAELHMEILKE